MPKEIRNTSNAADGAIAVIGMACRFPGANDVNAFWNNIAAGIESVRELSDAELEAAGVDPALVRNPEYVRRYSGVDGVELFDAEFFDFTARDASIAAPSQRLLMTCAYHALEDAGYSPKAYRGDIGVFVGANRCDEWQKRLYTLSDKFAGQLAKQLQFFIASELDYTATRISYKLNLTGPSITVSTACSTSLVAVIQACRSLRYGECDMALAGGSNVLVPQESGYLYEEGGIKSSDGSCRAFDADADGTIFGNGAGVVVLKRLQDAIADRDHIHAVIRGGALNNDGSAKVGYTAPSVTGQFQVIASALSSAGVDPEEIGYVETHGTGTALGDPIEIEALTKAYREKTKKKRYCAIGSVKTNIGHLGSAAGVAGFIKAVEALKHEQIPPSLHFKKPNPEIDFAGSPFFVNTELRRWPADSGTRYAAVSSFGVGGTNAHIILEEAPPAAKTTPSRKHQLMVLSAKSPSAVAVMSGNLANKLADDRELDLADVAYSLNTGRTTFSHRRAYVADGVDAAVEALRDPKANTAHVAQDAEPPSIAFLFPGQGAQHIRMGAGLYQEERIYREAVDECAEKLTQWLKRDLREILFPAQGKEEAAEAELRQTAIAQPALFVMEYALAQLWKSWGIQPNKMIGHSIGEYVAACLSGVFSLDDALYLVAERARLMQSMPTGAMLAVSIGEEELKPLLSGCELAVVNGPAWCVAAGPDAAIDNLEKQLIQREVSCRRLHTSHAFHSAMMEPMLKDYGQALRKVRLHPPKVPFLSNVTGDWINKNQATDPDYWARQLRSTVQFYAGARRLMEGERVVLLEVGPGQTLSTLVKTFQPDNGACTVLASCRQAKFTQHDQAVALQTLGQLWMAGAQVDWAGFYQDELRRRESLPGYPFEGRRYWLERRIETGDAHAAMSVRFTEEATPTAAAAEDNRTLKQRLGKLASVEEKSAALTPFVRDSLAGLLGVAEVPDDVPFIELGLSSLTAIELRTLLNNTLGADVSVVTLLDETATVSGLAALLAETVEQGPLDVSPESDAPTVRQAEAASQPMVDANEIAPMDFPQSATTIKPDPENQYQPFPLTEIQQAYWVGRHGTDGSEGVATYGYVETDIHQLDVKRYEWAVNQLVQRHHMLRMIVRDDGTQHFMRDVPHYHIPFEDLTRVGEADRQRRLDQLRESMSHQVLDPGTWPLFQIHISKLSDDICRIHFGFDFLIVDVLSLLVYFRDLFLVYQGEVGRLEPLEINFRDYVLAEKARKDSETYLKAKRYWMDRVGTLPAAPMLPLTKEATQIQTPRYTRRDFELDCDTWGRLKENAKRFRITPSVLIANVFSEVLALWSKQPKFTINLTIFNRPRLHPQINDLIGDFTSSVLLEVDRSDRYSFDQSAKKLQTQLLTDLEHRHFTGVEMLRAMNSQLGGYQAVIMPIVLTSALGLDQYSESRLVGLSQEQLRTYNEMLNLGYAVSQTSQVWLDHVVREKDGVLLCNWDALEELFPAGMLDDMFSTYYDRLVQLANEGESAWRKMHVPRLPAYQETRRNQVNNTEGPVSEELLQQIFEKTAIAKPQNTAVINGDVVLSYRDLHVFATRLGNQLRGTGVKPNQLVAVVMHKGWEQIAAVFGILYAGAAYMPVDAALPKDRIRQLLVQGEVTLALTQPNVIDTVDWPEGVQPIVIREEQVEANRKTQAEAVPLAPVQTSTDLAYVLFTSGSTGTPKGVMIDHQSAVNTVLDINRRYDITEADRAIAINALHFDLSVYDVFGLLAAGGALIIPDYRSALDPRHWAELVVKEGVTFWNTVPAIVQLYIEELESRKAAGETAGLQGNRIRWIFMSGDWIPVNLPDRIRGAIPSCRPISLGGPTETTVWSVNYRIGDVDPQWKSIPYGTPLTNRKHEILHADLSSCPEWVPGEIYTGGRVGLSKGYWRDEEKTNAVFIKHPDSGERLYRTGDWGRFLPDGNIEFLGREDKQVKVQGHRIELGEIEHALRQCGDVQDAVVLAARDESSDKAGVRLVAYVVEKDLAAEEKTVKSLKTGDTLTDPLAVAAFKLQQVGLRRFPAGAKRISLPCRPAMERPLSLAASMGAQVPVFSGDPIALERFGEWLSAIGQIRLDGYTLPKYYYPSAGSAYAVQTYLYITPGAVASLEGGVYYYDAENHELIRVARASEQAASLFPGLGEGRFALAQLANVRAIIPLYGKSALERFYGLEGGHIHNLLAATGAVLRIGLASYDACDPDRLRNALELDEDHHFVQCFSGGALAGASMNASDVVELDCITRQSYRSFLTQPMPRKPLERMLGHLSTFNDLPQMYLYVKPGRVSDLPGGFYGYDIGSRQLIQLHRLDKPLDNLQYTRNRPIHHGSAFSVLFVGRKPKGDRTAADVKQLLAAGYLTQAMTHVSTRYDIGICCTGGVKMDLVRPYLPLSANEDVLYCLEAGAIDPEQTKRWVTDSMQADAEQGWKDALRAKLPYYMVPAAFVRLKSFPLTPNGKVDRKALLSMGQKTPTADRALVKPRDALETSIMEIWRRVLEVKELSVEDNLFELGGDSLTATKLVSEVGKSLGLKIALHTLFAEPTVAGMANVCRALMEAGEGAQAAAPPSEGKAADLLLDFGDMTATLLADAVLDPSIVPKDTTPPETENPRNVLLTGATGFLGAYVLRELLERTSADIYCLARAGKTTSAVNRIIDNLKRYRLWQERYIDRVVAVEGDLSKDRFGLDESRYQFLSSGIDVIYHVGAAVNYARSYQDLKKTNVFGAESIIRFACQDKLKAVNFVSTKYLCFGLDSSGIRIHPAEAPVADSSGMFIGYTQSKWVAEKLFEQAMERGIPVAIYRPGQITGAMKGEVVMPDDAFHHLVALFMAMDSRPDRREWTDGIIDIVPVDFAARALAALGLRPTSYGKHFNLVNDNPMPIDRFFDVLERLSSSTHARGAYTAKSFDTWANECLDYVHNLEDATVGYVLEKFFVKTEHGHFIKGLFLNGKFATKNVSDGLQGTDIVCPPVDEGLCRRYFGGVVKEGVDGT